MTNYQPPDYPLPDPAWEYAGIWGEIWALKAQAEKTIKYMSGIEDPNNESDRIVRDHLEQLQIRLNSAVALSNNQPF